MPIDGPLNAPPIIDPISDVTVGEGQAALFSVVAADADADPIALSVAVIRDSDLSPVDPGLYSFTGTGNGSAGFSWLTTLTDAGAYTVTVTASDGTAQTSTTLALIVAEAGEPNAAPVLAPIADIALAEGETASFVIAASDADGDPITLGVSVTDDATGTPLDLDLYSFIDSGGGSASFSWLTTLADAGAYTVTVTASDGTEETSQTLALSVAETVEPNSAPVLDPVSDIALIKGQTASFAVAASDADGDPVTLGVSVTRDGDGAPLDPTLYSFTDNGDGTGSFAWATDWDDTGSYTVTVTAGDGIDQTSTALNLQVLDRIWVSPEGDDANAGTEAAPVQTIQRAIELAGPDTTILVKAGTYAENIRITAGEAPALALLTAEDRLEIISADGPGAAVITSADAAGVEPTIYMGVMSHVTIDGFQIVGNVSKAAGANDGGPLKIIGNPDGPLVDPSEDIVIVNNIFSGTGINLVKVTMTRGLVIENNIFEGTGESSFIDLVTVWESQIIANDFVGITYTGMGMKAGSQDILIEHNLFDFDGRGGEIGQTAILVGGVGASRLNRPPLPEEFSGFEAKNVSVIENVILSDTNRGIMFQGGQDSLVQGNLIGPSGGVAVHSTRANSPENFSDSGNNTIDGNILLNITLLNSYGFPESVIGTTFTNNVDGSLSDVGFSYGSNLSDLGPYLDPIGSITVNEGEAASFAVGASDAEGDPITLALTVTDDATGAAVEPGLYGFTDHEDGSASFSWLTTLTDAGAYTVAVTASDGTAQTSTTLALTVTEAGEPNTAPLIAPLADLTLAEGETASFAIAASDAEGDPITLALTVTDDATGAPLDPGLYSLTDLGNGSASFSWLTTLTDAGAYTVAVTASDGTAQTSTTLALTVNETAPSQNTLIVRAGGNGTVAQPPQFEVFADGVSLGIRSITAPLEQSGGFNVNDDALFQDYMFDFAGPAPSEVTIVYFNDGKSSGINRDLVVDYIDLNGTVFESEVDGFFNPDNGRPSLTGAREKLTVNGTLVFADLPDTGGGGPANSAPAIGPIGDIAVTEGQTASFAVAASDPDGQTPALTVAVTVTGTGTPVSQAQYSFTDHGDGTGSFAWITDDADAGAYTVTVTASDGIAQTTETLALTIDDAGSPANTAPAIDPIGDIAVTEGQTASFAVAASDIDGQTPVLSVAVTVTSSGASVSPAQYSFTDNGDGTGSFAWITDDTDAGAYTVVVTADDGMAQTTESLALTIDDAGGATLIQRVFLVNTETDATLVELAPGGVYQFTQAELDVMGIYTVTSADYASANQVRSVALALDGSVVGVDSTEPYALFGDANGDFRPGSLSAGEHTLTTQLFSGKKGNGTLLDSQTVTFELVDSLQFSEDSLLV